MMASEMAGLFVVLFLTGTVVGVEALLAYDWLMERFWKRKLSRVPRWLRVPWSAAFLVLVGCVAYAHWVEPFRFEVTRHKVSVARLPADFRLRILHLTDLHLEGQGEAAAWILETVEREKPDVIVLTGDYVNNYGPGLEAFDRLAKQLRAPHGVLAVTGNYDTVNPTEHNSEISTLHGFARSIEVGGVNINFVGLPCVGGSRSFPNVSHLPPASFTVMLHHTPELIDDACNREVDLYLCGHTHGGQVRVPFYGAVVTLSDTGKKYEAGRYEVGGMTAYVGRGVGNEGGRVPRLRFLCRPEIAVFDVVGEGEPSKVQGPKSRVQSRRERQERRPNTER